jgi:hypothetical protein
MWSKCAFTFVIGALLAAAFVGCGSDDEENPSTNQSTFTKCIALCDKQVVANCELMGMGLTREDCVDLCSIAQMTPQCEPSVRAFVDCQDALAMVCDVAICEDQAVAAVQCIAPDDAGGGG